MLVHTITVGPFFENCFLVAGEKTKEAWIIDPGAEGSRIRVEIQRLGLRFVNRIAMQPGETQFEEYIEPYPETPRGLNLPFLNFLHRVTLIAPGNEYGISLTQTLQIPQDQTADGTAIILDIDVFTLQPFLLALSDLKRRLLEMRWLKNKAFFGSITTKALEGFRCY